MSRTPQYRLTIENILKRLFAKKPLVKFIRANRLLPWIANNFQVKGIYLIIRHPCATIASQLKTFYKNGFPTSRKLQLLSEVSKIKELRNNELLIKKLHTLETPEEILATVWSVDYFIPLYYQRMFKWHTIVYEKLVLHPEGELKNIFSYIGEKVPEKAYSKIRIPSITTRDQRFIGTSRQLTKWKEELSEKQIKNILKVVHWFGLDFYTEDPKLDYNALKNWKPPF